jgi:chemotaxis response regulator CheB
MPTKKNPVINNPLSKSLTFPIVGIGASTGGLEAFEQFFSSCAYR